MCNFRIKLGIFFYIPSIQNFIFSVGKWLLLPSLFMAQVICSHCTEKCCHLSELSGWIDTTRKHGFDDIFLLSSVKGLTYSVFCCIWILYDQVQVLANSNYEKTVAKEMKIKNLYYFCRYKQYTSSHKYQARLCFISDWGLSSTHNLTSMKKMHRSRTHNYSSSIKR